MRFPGWTPPVLMYHRIRPVPSGETPTVSPEAFDRQMAILAKRWKPVPLSVVMEAIETGRPLPARAVAVTFDDGTDDNFAHAFPILERHRIPATIFLIAGRIGEPGFLTSSQIGEMAKTGISFGSHALNHENLPALFPEDLSRTLSESKKKIEGLGVPAQFFSYPGGSFNRPVMEAVRRAGYRGACTTNRGFRRFPPDRWALRRIALHGNAISPAALWLRCCGWYGLNRRLRAPC